MKFKTLLTVSLITLILFVVADVALRQILPPAYQGTKYGWSFEKGTQFHRVQDTPGNFRTVEKIRTRNGFRRRGDINTKKIKMFVLGDSFTQMQWVGNGEEWYAYLEKAFGNLELFVYGGGGYGTLQEYLILDDFIDKIKPDIILWQFSENDYVNNVFESDRALYPFNNFGVRPYLEAGEIVYRMPMQYETLRKYSAVADRFLRKHDVELKAKQRELKMLPPDEYNKIKEEQKRKFDQIRNNHRNQQLETTQEIFSLVKKRAGDTPVYLFSTSYVDEDTRSICNRTDIVCIEGIGDVVLDEIEKGVELKVVNNGHWNKAGNALAGQALVDYFRDNSILGR